MTPHCGLAAQDPWSDDGRWLALIWIAYQLMEESTDDKHGSVTAASSFRQAIQTIVVADAVICGQRAGGGRRRTWQFSLRILGLLISIPIVAWGSTLILKWVERFPVIIIVQRGCSGPTAAKMINRRKLVADFFVEHHGWKLALYVFDRCDHRCKLP